MGIRGRIKQMLTQRCEQDYDRKLEARKCTYEDWLKEQTDNRQTLHRQENGEPMILLLQAKDGVLDEDAPGMIRSFFEKHPEILIAYGDEDVQDPVSGERTDPWFKPDWSPDTFLESFYWGSVVAVRWSWLESKMPGTAQEDLENEVLEEGLVRLAVAAGGFERGCRSIGHIPAVLFHGRSREEQEHFFRLSMKAAVERCLFEEKPDCRNGQGSRDSKPLVSVVIPSKDHPDILENCLEALCRTAGDCNCEVLVTDNGSSEQNRARIERFLAQLPLPARYFYEPMEFHFARMCNRGAKQARGQLLLFLNDDVEPCCPGWLSDMVQKAMEPWVGAVGLKLYYPDSNRIQHDGIVNLPMGPVHKLQFLTDDEEHGDGFNRADRNVLAVTGACLMVHREKFREAGGFPDSLRVAFNDVGLCFGLWELGYHNVIINHAYAYHHESLSRGEDESRQKLSRLMEEKDRLYQLYPSLAGRDPYYPAGLNRDGLDTRIRPAYLTAGNRKQEAVILHKRLDLTRYRRDNCLLLRIEQCERDSIQGYCVVLGDNNACYEKQLLLWENQEEWEPSGRISCICIPVEGQFRPDLAENMADQDHVALCGFWLRLADGTIPRGEYRLGMAAASRRDTTRLVNWSSRVLKIR